MHLLFLSRASINARLEILTRRGICCSILPQGLHSCGSSPLNVIEEMCWHCLGSAWTREQDKKIGSRRQIHPCCSPVLGVNQALGVSVCDAGGLVLPAMGEPSALCFPELCGASSGVGRVDIPTIPLNIAALPAFSFCMLPRKVS